MDYDAWNGISDAESLSDVPHGDQPSSSPTLTFAASIPLKYTCKSIASDTSMDADSRNGKGSIDADPSTASDRDNAGGLPMANRILSTSHAHPDLSSRHAHLKPQPFPLLAINWEALPSPTSSIGSLDIESFDSDPSEPSPEDHNQSSETTDLSSSPLCEFCDNPMPQPPSVSLLNLRKRLEDLFHPRSRPTRLNPNHKVTKTTLDTVEYCYLHNFELNVLPQASTNGWPTEIDFATLETRVLSLVPRLQLVIRQFKDLAHPTSLPSSGLARTYELYKRQSRHGYYGQAGYIIVLALLQGLFSSISEADTIPLTVPQFIDQVLLPETFALLVEEDRSCGRAEALECISQSRAYGASQFPANDEVEKVAASIMYRYGTRTRYRLTMQ
ncbi:hypothetical protein ONZ45_g18622 [Pleurotus djamor]|nr:hypothetical protein ONZ45_g18622 [Pleurotus djamor]